MSAFVGLLFDDVVFLGTDTLASRPYQEVDGELKPLMFVPKVFHLPQLKCAFGCTGYQNIGVKFYEFITQRFVGKDISSIVNVGLQLFKKMVDESEYAKLYASLYLYGYDDTLKKFKAYRTYIGPDELVPSWIKLRAFSEMPEQMIFVMKPEVKDYDKKMTELYPDEPAIDFREFIRRLVVIQREEDDKQPPNQQVGIGGDIVLTTLGHNEGGHFVISSEVIHKFSDKEQVGDYMMRLLNT